MEESENWRPHKERERHSAGRFFVIDASRYYFKTVKLYELKI